MAPLVQEWRTRTSRDSDQLRAARAVAQYEGRVRLPYVRTLQRPPRRDCAHVARAVVGSRAAWRQAGECVGHRADPVRPARYCNWRIPLDGFALVRRPEDVLRHVARRTRHHMAARY